jgi:uncharacterized membrane protein
VGSVGTKDKYLKQRADKKLIVRHHLLQALIVFMFVIALHDSFRHQTLFYFLFDKAPLNDMGVTLTRTVLVAFPASFAATAMDFLK